MAESVVVGAVLRKAQGKREARRLRKQGKVPGVLYGHKEAIVSLSLKRDELEKVVRHGVRVIDLQVDNKKEHALIQEVQLDSLGKEILHVDFKRVSADEKVVVSVPLELKGHSPGVTAGGVLDQPIHSLQIECLAVAVPDHIRVNIGELQIGSVIHVRELVLPAGVKTLVEPDAVVVQVKAPVVEAPAAVTPEEAAAQAEPEIIGRRVAEEKEAEGEEKK